MWRDRWGLPVITEAGSHGPADVAGLVLHGQAGARLALVTWAVQGERAEIVSLDALVTGRGHGATLLHAAEKQLTAQGVRQLFLVTTNDNERALRFYLRQGYRLIRVHLDAMERVRARKPDVPEVSLDGVPIQDLWELEKTLS